MKNTLIIGDRIDVDELKSIQLNILMVIDEFCRNNEINYSLACGSLLGAIRHNGFIPWDDDIDIQLLREDYNKLLVEFPQMYSHVSLISLERDKRWNRAYARAYDVRTIETEGVNGEIDGIGVGIDVFPIDKVPNDEKQWLKYNKTRMFIQDIYQLKLMRWSKKRSLIRNLIVILAHVALFPLSLRGISKRIDSLAQKYNPCLSDYLYETCQGIGKNRERFLLSDFSDYIDADFENNKLKIIVGYDDYLKNTYGNYMVLPPSEKRVSHHQFTAYWKEPVN